MSKGRKIGDFPGHPAPMWWQIVVIVYFLGVFGASLYAAIEHLWPATYINDLQFAVFGDSFYPLLTALLLTLPALIALIVVMKVLVRILSAIFDNVDQV
jgi:hypothetical protein